MIESRSIGANERNDKSLYALMRKSADFTENSARTWSSALSSSDRTLLFDVMKCADVHPLEPRGRDVVARWIFQPSWGRLVLAVLVLLLVGCMPLFAAVPFGLFRDAELDLDAFNDVGYWNHIISAVSLAVAMGLFQIELPRVVVELCFLGICRATKEQFNTFSGDAENDFRGHFLTWIPWACALVITAFGVFAYHLTSGYWHSFVDSRERLICGILQMPMVVLTYYLAVYTLTRIYATYRVLKKFFALPTRVDPLHADGCGGLAPLGGLAMRLNLIVFVFGMIVVVGVLFNIRTYGFDPLHPTNILLMAGYVTASALVFFLPLYAARSTMYEARLVALRKCSKIAGAVSRRVLGCDSSVTYDEAKEKELARVQALHAQVERMPVYPFNTRIITSFLGSLATPVVLVLIERLITSIVGH